MKSRYEKLFQDTPVWSAIFKMAVPSMMSMVVMILYNMADMFFVGQIGDVAQVASVSLVGPVYTTIMAIGSMFGAGGCVLIAQKLGDKRKDEAETYASLSAFGGMLVGLVITILVLLGMDLVLKLLGAKEDTYLFAKGYLSILVLGAPLMIFSTTTGRIMSAEGAVKEGVFANILGTVTNILLDPLFILVFGMGVKGAAIATIIGNIVSSLYVLHYISRKSESISLSFRSAFHNAGKVGKVMAIGLPNGFSSFLSGSASAIANNFLVGYGTIAVAARAAAGKSTLLIGMIQMGVTVGVQPLLAYLFGAKDMKRLKETLTKLSLLTIGIGLVMAAFCFFNSKTVIGLFLKDQSALEMGRQFIAIMVLSGPFVGIYHVSSVLIQASGKAVKASFVSLLRQGIIYVPFIFILGQFFGLMGIVYAHLLSDIVSAAVALIIAVRQYHKTIKA